MRQFALRVFLVLAFLVNAAMFVPAFYWWFTSTEEYSLSTRICRGLIWPVTVMWLGGLSVPLVRAWQGKDPFDG